MNELSMPVRIFRGETEIGGGELLPNGSNMALCPDSKDLEIINFEADTEEVEAKIPMEFWLNNAIVSKGELYQSGDNYCLCPTDQELDMINPDSLAKLIIEPNGKAARLNVDGAKH